MRGAKNAPHFLQTHTGLVLSMVCITLLWSSAGVITRQMSQASGWDITFWRSAFTSLTIACFWLYNRGVVGVKKDLNAGLLLWASAACWAVMFTCFMLAMSYITVGQVLLMLSIGPFLTAVFARLFLKQFIFVHTWLAVIVAGAGLAYMFGSDFRGAQKTQWLGLTIALCVPFAGACNFLILQHSAAKKVSIDLVPSICIGAALSALFCLPAVQLLHPSHTDFLWLLSLGVFQLALPCAWLVWVSARLPAAEVSLLAVLEIIFGTIWAWLWGGETPSHAMLMGGSVVIAVLVMHALWSMHVASKKTT